MDLPRTLACMITILAPALLAAQTPVVYKIEAQQSENFGTSIVLLGDVNGDGVKDFAASKRYRTMPRNNPGKVILYSGKDGSVLRTWIGERELDFLGEECLAALPDLDGDGIPELGASAALQGVHVYSPVTGKKWYTITTFVGTNPNESPGNYFIRLPDMDGDGIAEFAGGFSEANRSHEQIDSGRITLFSGRTGFSLWVHWGSFKYGFFGYPMLLSGDHDGDGVPDILTQERLPNLVGRPASETEAVIRVISGRTGELLQTYTAPGPWHFLFGETMASLGDRDGNGFPEVAISAAAYRRDAVTLEFPGEDDVDGQGLGWVGIFSLPGFELLSSVTGREPRLGTFQGDRLGFTLAAVGDLDGDGITDFIAGASRTEFPAAFPYGRLYVCSGADCRGLEVIEGRQGFDTFFERLSPLGDIDGDGRPEFLAAHPSDDYLTAAKDATRAGAGSIFALRYDPSLPTYIRGDANGDGRVNLTDAVTILRYAADDSCTHHDPLPEPRPGCLAAYDINADGCISRIDALRLLQHLFQSYFHAPVSPFPECSRFLRIEPLEFFPDLGCKEPRPCGNGDGR